MRVANLKSRTTTSFTPPFGEIQIRSAHPISHMVIVANGCGYTQGLFWLPWRIALVSQENQIEDVRFLFSPATMPPLWPPKCEYNAVSAERSTKFGSVVRVETLRHLTKITALWRKASKSKVLAAKHTASLPITYLGGSFGAVTARVNTRLGPPLLITRPNPALGRAATAPEYFRTRFWAKRYIIQV